MFRKGFGILLFALLLARGLSCGETSAPKPSWKVYEGWPFSAAEAKRRQEETARALGVPVEKRLDLGHGVKMALVLIPAGEFVMGTPVPVEPDWGKLGRAIQKGQGTLALGGMLMLVFLVPVFWRTLRKQGFFRMSLGRFMLFFLSFCVAIIGGTEWWQGARLLSLSQAEFAAARARFETAEDAEKPAHRVVLSQPFYMGKYEVTQEEWGEVMRTNPSQYKGLGQPVANVSWDDTRAFCEKAKDLAGVEVRLPSEAEWEYACRAGSGTAFYNVDEEECQKSIVLYGSNWGGIPDLTGQKKVNAFGLFDMLGNAWEWIEDDWHKNYQGVPADGRPWKDAARGELRVFRGASWNDVRCTWRGYGPPVYSVNDRGFRIACAMSIEKEEKP